MLCQAHAAASFAACEKCLGGFLLSVWALVNKTHAQLGWDQAIDLGQWRPDEDIWLSGHEKTFMVSMFRIIVLLYCPKIGGYRALSSWLFNPEWM